LTFEFQEQTPASKTVALAEGLKKLYSFATMEDTKEIYYFDKEQGFHVPAETKIESTVKQDPACKIVTKHQLKEVLYHIQTTTYRKRSKFDSDPDWLHVSNGWVNIRTGAFEEHSAGRLSLSKIPPKYDPNAVLED
jgi:phage/plasmid-associated DNA primase